MAGETKWTPGPPPDVTRLDLAFGNIDHLPPWEAIPDDFRRDRTPWNRQVGTWFFSGADKEWVARITPKAGIDKQAALAAVQAVLRSWAPKHEHKEAGAAYLLSLWFDDPALAKARGKEPSDGR
jgi:hypothetical protein